jgi:hypothetical protein
VAAVAASVLWDGSGMFVYAIDVILF